MDGKFYKDPIRISGSANNADSSSRTFSFDGQEKNSNDDFPEGGRAAWAVVLGAWCCIFSTAGWIACMGVFQTYYQVNQLKAYSASAIAWILSTQSFFFFGLAPWIGLAFDRFGPRALLIGGTLLHITGLLSLALSSLYYQIFLSQSVCSAIGASIIFWTSGLTVATWFQQRRGLASGIAGSGSSVSGALGWYVFFVWPRCKRIGLMRTTVMPSLSCSNPMGFCTP